MKFLIELYQLIKKHFAEETKPTPQPAPTQAPKPVEPKVEPKPEVKPELPSNVIPINHGNSKNPDWDYLWETCEIDPQRSVEVVKICAKIRSNIKIYLNIQARTNVPWYDIAAWHYRESGLDFTRCLHNGEKLVDVNLYGTRLVPKGRGKGKNWDFEEAAVDALRLDGMDKVRLTSVVASLVMSEKYNGMGYRKTGELSPYVWAGTNHHDETGKYKSDGKFDPNAPEKQLGVAAIFKGLGL